MSTVHPSAVLDGEVTLGDDVVIGPHCVLTGPITIGAGSRLLGGVYLHGPLTMGDRNVVYPSACLGFAPQHAKFDPGEPGHGLVIGNENTFRESVTFHRAFTDEGPTRVGDRNVFMVNAHVGHDCQIGNDGMFVNNTSLGGHCIVEDKVTIGGSTVVHQFCRLGRGAMLTGGAGAPQDIAPWFMLTGYCVCGGVNLVGMRRHGMPREDIDCVRWVYRTLYRSGRSFKSAVEEIRSRSDEPLIAEFVKFIEGSKRGLCPGQGDALRGTA